METYKILANTSIEATTNSIIYVENTLNDFWLYFYTLFDGNGLVLHALIPHFLTIVAYWIIGGVFTAVDVSGRPHFIAKYKVPDPNANQIGIITRKRITKTVKQVLFNQFIVATAIFCLAYGFKQTIRNTSRIEPFKIHTCIGDIILALLLEEIFFYYLHRLFHQFPWLYVRFHKQHHEWTSPIAISAICCHPVEHVFSNVLPILIGWIFLDYHGFTFWVWCTIAAPSGVILHSGYHLPFMPPPEFHHYHHMKFNENFGIFGIMDWIHGTDKKYRKSEWYRRYFVLTSLKPVQ